MVYNTTQHPPPPPQLHTVCIYCTFSLRRGGGQREGTGTTVHKYSSFVHGGNSSQSGSKITTMSERISSLLKSVIHNAAKSINRSKPTLRVWCLYSLFVHGPEVLYTTAGRPKLVKLGLV
jgi:hypothetical protein